MPVWVTLAGYALKVLGLVQWAESLYARYTAKQQGRAEQHSADLEASVKEAKDAAKISDDVRRLSDSDLDNELRNGPARKP
jgi:hypothetical protein